MMHGQISGSKNDSDVVPFARAEKNSGADQLDKAGQTILQLLHRAAALRMKTVGTRWRRRRSSRISCAQPKFGLRS